ncbi:MAG: YesL family protein [Clostridiaceae bacterium]|nr:YesL family protein [Oscillospiraceae bacterium]NLO63253.1 YesL family protein [Clostridiaceae bacterium]
MNIFSYNSPFGRFMNRLVDVILLSLLTIICCLPIITAGAAFSALYYVLLKMVRDNDNGIIRSYFKGFKDNFLKATALWLIVAPVIVIVYLDFYLLSTVAMDYSDVVKILLLIIGALLLMVGNYIFPMQAQFENTVWGTLKKAFILSIMNLPKSLIMLLIMASPIVILLFFPETVYFLPFFCIAAIPYLKTEILVRIFDQYMPKETDGEASGEPE